MGDVVWTYKRRATDKPEPVQGQVLVVLDMPSFYPPQQYILQVEGTLVVRDQFTCARNLKDVPVFTQDQDMSLYHD